MSNPSTTAILVFTILALVFMGVILVVAAVLDRNRAQQIHEDIPERAEGAFLDPPKSEPGPEQGEAGRSHRRGAA